MDVSDFDSTVLEFMDEYGATGYLKQVTEGAYDPATGTIATATVSYPIQGILQDLTLQSNGLSTKYGTLVEAGDKELLMRPPNKTSGFTGPAIAFNPNSDRITFAGVTYKIVTMKELNPTGTAPILYSLYLRR